VSNINGYCPHCNADLDGDLVINYPLTQGKTMEEAFEYASFYAGWDEHKERNRWGRAVALYDIHKDRTAAYRCPDCEKIWDRSVL
jgi:ssDNA-binding Zn-finger/Zn-ribbon topoisomerase 1